MNPETMSIRELLDGFGDAMLVTHAGNGHLRARPMHVARAEEGGDLWFATRLGTPKVGEIQGDAEVNVTMQAGQRFVSLCGRAHLVQDKETLERLWDEAWRAWLPEGKGAEALALIHVTPIELEYWERDDVRLHYEPGKPIERRDPAT